MIDETIDTVRSLLTKWDPSAAASSDPSLFRDGRAEARDFIASVNHLRRVMHLLLSAHSPTDRLLLAHTLLQLAMKRLEKEFYQLLCASRHRLDADSISAPSSRLSGDEDAVSEDYARVADEAASVCDDLRMIADCMIRSGYGKECAKIYKIIRKSIVDEEMYRMGIERLRSAKVQRFDGEVLEKRIHDWINASKTAVTTLFRGERILCDHLFPASESIRESCFSEVSREGAVNLLRFPELVAKTAKSSRANIFRLLDLHEAMSDLQPAIELTFSFESTAPVRSQACNTLLKLSNAVRASLSEFESSIQNDSSKKLVDGGGIHELTRSAMGHLVRLADYSPVLSDIVAQIPAQYKSPFPESFFAASNSGESPAKTLSVRIAWLVLVLLCKLDTKANLYKDVSLSYLFLANNLHFVVERVRRSNLRRILGEEWVSKHSQRVKQYAAKYESAAWTKILHLLPEKQATAVPQEEAKECFRRFNEAFEEAYRKQRSWVVVDGKLRDEIKVSIAKNIVPAYREFYDTYVSALRGEKDLELLVRFCPDNLGNYLSDMFHRMGSSTSTSSSSSWSSSLRKSLSL
ncbi:exocyst complex component EXO70H1-like [Malania oleifera]|uniref:exocyst complex component EXO70H1-like n=1 Tax=Malania oleifera TaxID=397392 RepID=UPI0025AE8A1E|nr:exocyst complex component EXO70H1-like [Malania oleifera]